MTIPAYDRLMFPVLKLLSDKIERTGDEITNIIAKQLNLSEEEVNKIYENNPKKIFKDRIAWARTYLKKAGLIESPQRTTSKITKEGSEFINKGLTDIKLKDLEQFKSYREFRNLKLANNSNEIEQQECIGNTDSRTPIDLIIEGKNLLNNELENDLLNILKEKDATLFETIVAKLLVNMGYGSSYNDILQIKGKSGDEGIDGIIKQDALGLDKVYIQAKKWTKSTVSGPEIQKFAGALRQKHATKGVFITTSTFTEAAKKCAKEVSDTIVLIDGQQLTKLMIRFNVGVQINETIEIKKIDEDFFIDD